MAHPEPDETPEKHEAYETQPAPVEYDDEELEAPHRAIDPAFVYLIFVVITLFGLSNVATDVRFTLLWSLLTAVAVLCITLDNVEIERIQLRHVAIGLGFGSLVGVPFLAIGAPQLQRFSIQIFGKPADRSIEVAVFQMLAITMPLAETLFFRGAFQAARGLIFTCLAAGAWTIILFFPQLDVLKLPLLAVVFGLCFIFVNFLYSYVRERFGLFASWSCQITVNVLLLFVARFM